jgi:hypothetical protein
MSPSDAKVVNLSTATRAVIWKSGVTFIRGTSAWTLSDTELRKLVAAASVSAVSGS